MPGQGAPPALAARLPGVNAVRGPVGEWTVPREPTGPGSAVDVAQLARRVVSASALAGINPAVGVGDACPFIKLFVVHTWRILAELAFVTRTRFAAVRRRNSAAKIARRSLASPPAHHPIGFVYVRVAHRAHVPRRHYRAALLGCLAREAVEPLRALATAHV